jgi:hypothetical protein
MRKPMMALIAGILVVGTSGPALAHHSGVRGVSAEFQGICLTQQANPSRAILDGEVFIEESRRDVRRIRVTWKLHARPRDRSGEWTVVGSHSQTRRSRDGRPILFVQGEEGEPLPPPVDGTRTDHRLVMNAVWVRPHKATKISHTTTVTSFIDETCRIVGSAAARGA